MPFGSQKSRRTGPPRIKSGDTLKSDLPFLLLALKTLDRAAWAEPSCFASAIGSLADQPLSAQHLTKLTDRLQAAIAAQVWSANGVESGHLIGSVR